MLDLIDVSRAYTVGDSTVEALQHFVYRTLHAELLRQRHAWFEKLAGAYTALWWVPEGHIPGIDEAKRRIAHLDAHGPSQFAFTFNAIFPADEAYQQGIDGASFRPCPAV